MTADVLKVFFCDVGKNFCYKDIKSVFAKCNMLQLINSKQTVPNLKSTIGEQYFVKRQQDTNIMLKL